MRLHLGVLLLLFLSCLLLETSGADAVAPKKRTEKVSVVKDSLGNFHILYLRFQRSRKIPDEATVRFLGFDPAEVKVVQDSDLSNYVDAHVAPLPSLAEDQKKSLITRHVQKIAALSPIFFWKEMYLLPWVLNPSITKWQKRLLVAWRNGVYNEPIHFGYMDFSDNEFHISQTVKHWNIGKQSVKMMGFNALAEDPRVIPRPDGSLMVQYTSKASLFNPPKQTLMHILPPRYKGYIKGVGFTENKNSENVSLTDSVLMDGHFMDAGQKNWVAIPKEDQVYFLANINPMLVMVSYDVSTIHPNVGMLATVYNGSKVELPWSEDYGWLIRGGTPAIYLEKENLYLAFFHTVANIIAPHVRTYFMGAITFCPDLPFHIHSMSPYPILKEALYEGPTVQKDIDHVIFPTGLVLDDDKEHVLLSFGSNDHGGYLNKFNVAELLATLDSVHSCKLG